MKTAGIIACVIGGLFVLAVIGSALNLITIPWLKFDSQVQMNRDIITKTYSADNAIYNYHWFQEMSGEIKATQAQAINADAAVKDFEASAGARAEWSFEDKTEDARLRQVSLGLHNQYASQVAEYNARASEADRAIFQDGLPLFFSLNPF